MFRQLDFRSWFTFLGRNRLYTAVNFAGLTLALAFVLLVADYTLRQFTVDNCQTRADRIYAVCSEESVASGYYLQKHLRDRYPEIESTCAVAFFEDSDAGSTPVEIGRQKFLASVLYADTTFFRMFDFPLLEGSREEALAAREHVVLSESFARKVFGTFNPLGQTLRVDNDERTYVVSAVMRDIERSTIPAADIVMRAERITETNAANDERMSNSGAGVTFVLARPGADLQAKVPDMLSFFREIYWPYQGNVVQQVRLVPLRDLYFDPVNNANKLAHGSRSFLLILLGVGLVVLVFAVMNYINLTVAQSGFRAREMAARRLLGASRGNIFLKWILESTLFCAAALLFASCFAELFAPWASRLLGVKVAVWDDISWPVAGVSLLAVVALGVVSGLAPALVVSRYQPIDIVRGTFRHRTRTLYGRLLIALQNVITIALLAASITIGLQIRHLVQAPLGYETRDILNIGTDIFPDRSSMRRFCDELHSLPEVEAVGLGCGTPHDRGNNNTIAYGPDRMVSFQVFVGDSTYFRMLGLERLRDNHVAVANERAASRNFWASNVWYINRYALRELGIAEDAPEFRLGEDLSYPIAVAGIYRDFQIGTALDAPTSALLRVVNDPDGFYPWNILVKTGGDHAAAYRAIEELFAGMTDGGFFAARYLTDEIADDFAAQRRLLHIIGLFTLVALLISSLGLFAMAAYYIQQRRQEIAVRRVFGATRGEMLSRLVRRFMILVGAAFVIAVPVAVWGLRRWLEEYSVRIALSPWIFLAAGLFAAVVALLSVGWQSRRAADADPIESLKN